MQPKELIQFLDLTSLNEQDSEKNITDFLQKASTVFGKVAAVCIYPQFVSLAKKILQKDKISLATVINFPQGNKQIEAVLTRAEVALKNGADEIDVVINYKDYLLQKKSAYSIHLIQQLKKLCGTKILKAILETGELKEKNLIEKASLDAILAGADFLKTSTGKTSQGASLKAVEVMLDCIKSSQKKIGLKISGGIKTYEQVLDYIQLIEKKDLQKLLQPKFFRIGASILLEDLLQK